MSYYGLLTMYFYKRPASYTDIFRKPLDNGWNAGNGNREGLIGIDFRIGSGELQHQGFPRGSEETVLSFTSELEARGARVTFDMNWTEDGTRISVSSDPDGKKLSVRVHNNGHTLPGFEPYTDHTWFTPKLLGPVQLLECIVDVLEWDESP